MKLMVLGILAVLGLPALAEDTPRVVVTDQGQTYEVEVLSTDVPARTITYRSRDGRSTMTVADPAMVGLRSVKAGDTINITLRDTGGVRREVVAIVRGTADVPANGRYTSKTIATTTTSGVVSVVPAAPATSVIRVHDDGTGVDREYTVNDQALVRFRPLRAGEKVLVSWRYTPNGEPEAVVRIAHSPNGLSGEVITSQPGTMSVLGPNDVVASPSGITYSVDGEVLHVVSSDLRERTLTVRNANGDLQTVIVDGRAMDTLRGLREGDSVMLSLANGRVVMITRQ
jgi:hypothetical protein